MEDMAKILANYGFPIAITMFLLIRMEKTITDLKNVFQVSMTELKEAVIDLTKENTDLKEKVSALQEKLIALLEKRRK